MVVYEIEDYNGNTILAFRVKKDKILSMLNCDIADEDKDYLFNSKDNLVRIQMRRKLIKWLKS